MPSTRQALWSVPRLARGLLLVALAAVPAWVAVAAASGKVSDHARRDIERHRAMALAHEGAARCLESGRPYEQCQRELQAACKGLAIGKYCGMRHEH
ncbi:MAG: hypothetical protein RI988_1108 [Pseudomonadota bacterium]|jgi:hypothetical protein